MEMVLVARFDMGIYVHVHLFWIPVYLFLCFYVGPCAERQTSNIMLSAGHKFCPRAGITVRCSGLCNYCVVIFPRINFPFGEISPPNPSSFPHAANFQLPTTGRRNLFVRSGSYCTQMAGCWTEQMHRRDNDLLHGFTQHLSVHPSVCLWVSKCGCVCVCPGG